MSRQCSRCDSNHAVTFWQLLKVSLGGHIRCAACDEQLRMKTSWKTLLSLTLAMGVPLLFIVLLVWDVPLFIAATIAFVTAPAIVVSLVAVIPSRILVSS